jgi:DNA-directed RNA polymerase specialized sigma subunit
MVYVEGHTLAEVARRMGIDRSWAVRLHQRVIEHLGQTLRAKGKDPPGRDA